MAKVKVLIEGKANFSKENQWQDYCSIVLVETDQRKIIFDPGPDRKKLLKAFSKEGLVPEEIDYVFISHKHLDHSLLMGIFPNASVCTGRSWYKQDKGGRHDESFFGSEVKIIPTPGHTNDHHSLLVETDKGKVLLAGDLFWWDIFETQETNYKGLVSHHDRFVTPDDVTRSEKLLGKSRQKALKIADWIIPGHGKMFKNPRR